MKIKRQLQPLGHQYIGCYYELISGRKAKIIKWQKRIGNPCVRIQNIEHKYINRIVKRKIHLVTQ